MGSRAPRLNPKRKVIKNPAIPLGDMMSATRTPHGERPFGESAAKLDVDRCGMDGLIANGSSGPISAASRPAGAKAGGVTGPSVSATFLSPGTSHFCRSFCSTTSNRATRSNAQTRMQKMKGAFQPSAQ